MDFTQVKSIRNIIFLAALLPALCTAGSSSRLTLPKGFYVGANVALTSTNIKNNLDFNAENVDDVNLYNRNQYGSNTQVQPGFLIGYEYNYLSHWLLSVEAQANFIKSYINMGGTDYVSNVMTANNQYALQARAGYNLSENDNTLFALIGAVRTTQSVKIIFDNTNLTPGALGDLQLSPVDSSHNVTGLKLGVGYEKHITDNLGIRLDYSHTMYDNADIPLIDTEFFPIFGASGTSTVSQATDMLTVTLMLMS